MLTMCKVDLKATFPLMAEAYIHIGDTQRGVDLTSVQYVKSFYEQHNY
jgi:hypothetical protein